MVMKKLCKNTSGLGPNAISNGDIGNSFLLEAVRIYNKISKAANTNTIDEKTVVNSPILSGNFYATSTDEFISKSEEFINLITFGFESKFDSMLGAGLNVLLSSGINIELTTETIGDLTEMKKTTELTIEASDYVTLDYFGFNLAGIEDAKSRLDSTNWIKQSLLILCNNMYNDIITKLSVKSMRPAPIMTPVIPAGDGYTTQQLEQPLVQFPVINYVPDFSGNAKVSKHFVITQNVYTTTPEETDILAQTLESLSDALDIIDADLGLKEPSKFVFSQFMGSMFQLVRINKDGHMYNPLDKDNYITIFTDEAGQIQMVRPVCTPVAATA